MNALVMSPGARGAGTHERESTLKKGYTLPRAPMTNSDLTRLINSDEIQSIVRPPKNPKRGRPLKKNPLKNLGALLKLNPYAKTSRRQQLLVEVRHTTMMMATLLCTGGKQHFDTFVSVASSNQQWCSCSAFSLVNKLSCFPNTRMKRSSGLHGWACPNPNPPQCCRPRHARTRQRA